MSTQDSQAARLTVLQSRASRLGELLSIWIRRDTAENKHRTRKAAWDALGEIQQLEAFLGMLQVDLSVELWEFMATLRGEDPDARALSQE